MAYRRLLVADHTASASASASAAEVDDNAGGNDARVRARASGRNDRDLCLVHVHGLGLFRETETGLLIPCRQSALRFQSALRHPFGAREPPWCTRIRSSPCSLFRWKGL